MLRFLKSLFGLSGAQPEQAQEAVVKLEDLESWLYSARAPIHERIKSQIASSRDKIAQISKEAREKLSALQSASLLNPNIPERAKDYMTGNREEYSRRVTQYLDKIALPEGAEGIGAFLDNHAGDAKDFTQGILRPFQILQEFFANESKEITSMLADIEREIEALRAVHLQAKPEQYMSLNMEISQLSARRSQLAGLEREQSELVKQRNEAEKSIAAINTEETRLINEQTRQELLKKAGEAQSKIKIHEQKIRDVFNNFEAALRKFYRMATRNVKLVEKYLKDPVATLIEDLHLDILEAVADIQRLIDFDRLALGDKKEYVVDAMALLTKQYLGTWLREYGQLAKAEKDAQKSVEECDASKTLVRLQKLRDDTRRNMQLTEQRIANVKKDTEKINLNTLKQKLAENIKNTTSRQVTITF